MALNKETLKNSLKTVFQQMSTNDSQENSIEVLADRLSTVIYDFVKTAEVQEGQSVSTTGTAAAQTGQTTTKGIII
ncbi:hypothetical protein J0383_07785 [Flavobacterium endoglycinae]|uniref:Uncharacterized protein n=1 Tax=Flavobacterium endoglycinae TaxID=2816357 RepID=A0ABX7QK07_9FLAO|nr:hypothetical protein [Flavobacterium endoglycinae]QSW90699.1 hypothetical protein J0383_07785 [Flavobacterium endoglycinae]